MPMCEIKDHKTGETLKAYDFGGPEIYYAGTSLVYAPLGGTSVSTSEHLATLQPLGITSIMKPRWEVTGHTNVGTANWRVSVVDTSTGETKDGVYPFNLQGNVYELECQPGTWVMASCGGFKIESSWSGKTAEQAYRLKGTGEIIYTFVMESYRYSSLMSSASAKIRIVSSGSIGFELIAEETENPYEVAYVLERPTLSIRVPTYDFSDPNTCPMVETYIDATYLVNFISNTTYTSTQTGNVYQMYKLDFSNVKSHLESYYQSFVQNDTVFPYKTNLVVLSYGNCYIELYSKLEFTTEPSEFAYDLQVITKRYLVYFSNTTPEVRLKLSNLSYTQLFLMAGFS